MNDDRTLMEKNRKAFERAYAAIPAITPTKETAWQIWNAALSAAPAQEPVAWMTRESKRRLAAGGNCKGAVPVHGKPSSTATIPLYASPLPQEPQEVKALTDSDQMRAEFMAWAQDRGCDTDGAWSAWQACWNLRGAQEGKAGEDEAEFTIESQDGVCLAAATGQRAEAWAEIQHYAAQYAEEGPLTIYEVTRKPVATLSASSKGEQR